MPQANTHKEQDQKPEWWPKCPYPEKVFTANLQDYIKAVPDERLRTAISGYLGRHFWHMASETIWEAMRQNDAS